MTEYIIKIQSEDQIGLVYRITKIMFDNNLNVIDTTEFVDTDSKLFFMRLVVSGEIEVNDLNKSLEDELGSEVKVLIRKKNERKNVVIMVTKEIHCIGDILIRHLSDELNINICAVIGNHDNLRSFVEKFGLKYHTISHEGLTREEHEEKIQETLDSYNPDIIVLAKYMRILSEEFVNKYNEKILNIHHSFLPAFIGANPYHRAHQRGVKLIGATAHIVTKSLDEGPIITQNVEPVDHNLSIDDLILLGKDVEKIVLAKALNLIIDDRVFVNSNKTIIL